MAVHASVTHLIFDGSQGARAFLAAQALTPRPYAGAPPRLRDSGLGVGMCYQQYEGNGRAVVRLGVGFLIIMVLEGASVVWESASLSLVAFTSEPRKSCSQAHAYTTGPARVSSRHIGRTDSGLSSPSLGSSAADLFYFFALRAHILLPLS